MKTILVLLILFCVIVLPAFGELTDADLDKIRLIVKEEVKTEITGVRQEIAGLRQEMKAEIAGSEKRIKDYIDAKIESVKVEIGSVDKRFSTYNWVIYILMPLIVVAIGAPTSVMAWRSGRDRSLERQVETLKEQRIVNP